jgi:AraC-like DNA-binding protein
MDFTPTIIARVSLEHGRIDLVEWHWPDMIDFVLAEGELMLEMSLPPYATDATAEFPDIAPGRHAFVGTLFIRYPGVAVHGRSAGGRIRVLRCVFSAGPAGAILGGAAVPPLGVLQRLLDLRSKPLRAMMGLALRELTGVATPSQDALEAIHSLVAVELRRLFERQPHGTSGGRLAGWQYRRIRARLSQDGAVPTVAELAALCGISTRHLHRQFHALTGSSVADYVENFWVERARTMLAHSDAQIKAIAQATGFSHPNSFARAFRRATGMTPRAFRQTLSGNGVNARSGPPGED